MTHTPVTALSNRSRALPTDAASRLDVAEAAVASLEHEHARLRRLGLEPAIDRCESERRYWNFARALVRIAQPAATLTLPEDATWSARDPR